MKNNRSLRISLMTGLVLLGGVVVLLAIYSCSPYIDSKEELHPLSKQELIKRGEYLVNTSACHDCHSPKILTPHGPVVDSSRMLSGHPADLAIPVFDKQATKDWVLFSPTFTGIAGPWGVSFAANLTSDETGIGNWTEEQFFTAIRKGKYKGLEGSRGLLPPMPWEVYRMMTDEDLRAIFYYLKSTRPVRNLVPAPIAP